VPQTPHSSTTRSLLIAVTAVLTLLVVLFGIVRLGSRGEVLGSVTVLDVELGGTDTTSATRAVVDLEERLANLPAPVEVDGADANLLPLQAGFDLQEDQIVARAMEVGRSSNPVADFFWWLTHLTSTVEVAPSGSLDPEALEEVLDQLDASLIGDPPFEGALTVEADEIVVEYPTPGRRISREPARRRLLDQFLTLGRRQVVLPVRQEEPSLTAADFDAARSRATLMVSAPVVLTLEDGSELAFSTDQLRGALVAEVTEDPPAVDLGFAPEAIEARLDEVRADYEAAPVDARFEISGNEVTIVAGSNGTLIDAEATAQVLEEASRTSVRRAPLPLVEGAEPEVTTADLEALDIHHLVSQFTTFHDCCGPRVTNIHLIADEVDGAIVAPGETFSLNDHVGQRTEEEGYLPDGTIIGGEIVDTVGGGVSQFATTFYNAVFWGGYEDVEHKPHSFYFSRYPEGIEATISWPQPDLVFRNDDDSGILIRTEYSDTAITVKFYGNNDGRILVGQQSGGSLSVGVVAEGGPDAEQIRGDRSDRYDIREPPPPLYRGNPELAVDDSRVVQSPGEGWSLTVTRTTTVRGETTTEEWPVRYLAQQEIIEVHPCKVPDTTETCPTTTTSTTEPPSTTSSSPPSTQPTDTTQPSETTSTTAGGG
jgi:vancomycin resistance protein YoaR